MSVPRIFVSHSHKDNAFCQMLVKALRDTGADVWYDEHNLGFGHIRKKIKEELQQRQFFILILSPASLQSDWVRDETEWFYDLSRKSREYILPVVTEQVEEKTIWLFLRQFKRIEQAGGIPFPQEEAIRRTLSALGLTPKAEPAPPPEDFKQGLAEAQREFTPQPMPQATLRLRRRGGQTGVEQVYRLDREVIQIGRHVSNDMSSMIGGSIGIMPRYAMKMDTL